MANVTVGVTFVSIGVVYVSVISASGNVTYSIAIVIENVLDFSCVSASEVAVGIACAVKDVLDFSCASALETCRIAGVRAVVMIGNGSFGVANVTYRITCIVVSMRNFVFVSYVGTVVTACIAGIVIYVNYYSYKSAVKAGGAARTVKGVGSNSHVSASDSVTGGVAVVIKLVLCTSYVSALINVTGAVTVVVVNVLGNSCVSALNSTFFAVINRFSVLSAGSCVTSCVAVVIVNVLGNSCVSARSIVTYGVAGVRPLVINGSYVSALLVIAYCVAVMSEEVRSNSYFAAYRAVNVAIICEGVLCERLNGCLTLAANGAAGCVGAVRYLSCVVALNVVTVGIAVVIK